MNSDIPLIERAFRIALAAHEGQMRKTDATPYITHPVAVAFLLAREGFSETVIAAALTHDVLEDTEVGEEELGAAIGSDALAIVQAVSEDKELPWEERKQAYIDSVRNASADVKAVSLGDKLHNLQSLFRAHAELGSAVWERFNRGKEAKLWFEESMLAALKEGWEHPLIAQYEALIEKMRSLD